MPVPLVSVIDAPAFHPLRGRLKNLRKPGSWHPGCNPRTLTLILGEMLLPIDCELLQRAYCFGDFLY